ncbi:MAG: type II toxin-antitoxin system RelE/ParE family toxin [Oscillatoria sp. PMC 1051.18]|nr:type II toxin-antitoxin system RelE/ParE family toxin [Oscillatoria sp. PMC 1050.18]MEC5032519.1 type II toxin-antitoxin system RelE/ParE family toxin [Oscillatoria sp. PMC 1051.18]
MYTVELTKKAQKQLKALFGENQTRISAKIDSLSTNPRPSGVKALKGLTNLLRLRVGDYRIIYQIEDERLLVLVVEIGHRREVYRSLSE